MLSQVDSKKDPLTFFTLVHFKKNELKQVPFEHKYTRNKFGAIVGFININCCSCIYIIELPQYGYNSSYIDFSWWTLSDSCSDNKGLEKLAHFIIKNIPDESFVYEANTLDLIIKWMQYKNNAINIARCLLAGRQLPDNPLEEDLKKGIIDQFEHDLIWLEAGFYENLWKLVHLNWRKFKNLFTQKEIEEGCKYHFPFQDSYELMEEILRESNYSLLNYLKPYYKKSMSEFKRMANLNRKRRREEITSSELNKLFKLIDKHKPQKQFWTEFILNTAEILAKEDPLIQTYLKIIDDIVDGLDAMTQKAACNPTLNRSSRSEEWVKGQNCQEMSRKEILKIDISRLSVKNMSF